MQFLVVCRIDSELSILKRKLDELNVSKELHGDSNQTITKDTSGPAIGVPTYLLFKILM